MTNTSPGYITFRIFESFSELLCVFSTRVGGYSRGLFKGQNLGNKKFDQNKLVDKNRQEFFNHFGITETAVAIPEQIHSSGITFVSSAGIIPQTDALITPTPNVFLVVQTADCFPVFIYDPVQKTCAIIHAGWRGAIQNIITETLKKLETFHKSKKSDIYVAVGPGLQQECFEVREDVYRLFPQQYLHKHREIDKRYLNLRHFIQDQILESGIPEVQLELNDMCTKCRSDLFYSYRRDGQMSGRMMGLIGIKP